MKRICLFQILLLQIAIIPVLGVWQTTYAYTKAPKSDADVLMVKKIRVKIAGTFENKLLYENMAKRLIRLRPGDFLTSANIQTSVDALSLSNRFASIHVDTESAGKGETVVFTLTPFRFIEDIVIDGSYPLFEKDIVNRMTTYPGGVFRYDDLEKQAKLIKALYRQEGYIAPKVNVIAKEHSDTDNVTLNVQIQKGTPYIPGKLTFNGNKSFGTTWLKPKMKTWRMGLLLGAIRFTEERLKKDIEKLKNYYRKKGFAEVEITYELDTKSRFPKVDVTLNIFEGPRYEVEFEGNDNFWDFTLKKDLALFSQGNRRGLGLRKSIQNIKQRYLKAGFLDVKVRAESDDSALTASEEKKIRFMITEGPQSEVSLVMINGNEFVSEEEIREQILTRPPGLFHSGVFVKETIEEDIFAINTLYLNRGFQDAKIDYTTEFTPDKRIVIVDINIDEGPLTNVKSVAISGADFIDVDEVKKELQVKSGQPFRANMLKTDEGYLSGVVSEKGYPHVLISSKVNLNEDHTSADIIYQIDSGPRVHLGEIYVSGNLRTKEKVILRELEIDPGDPLSLQKLADGQRALRDLDIFQKVQYKAIGLKDQEDTVNLFVEVQENKPYYAQFGVGYESDVGMFGRAKLGDSNFWGLNKNMWASAEFNEIGHEIRYGISEPRLLGSRISASLELYNEYEKELNQTFGTDIYGGSLGFSREWSDHFSTSLAFALETIDRFGHYVFEDVDDPRTVLITTPTFRYDNRDSFIKPTHGFVTELSIDISKRIERIERSSDDFFKYNVDVRYYHSPAEKFTLAWLARFGHIQPYGSTTDIPVDQLFFLGGTNDVRGFKENMLKRDNNNDSMGGRTAIVGSLEARFDIGWNLELTTFVDAGSVQESNVSEGSDEFRSSAGLGLRYMTAIGPIGLLYGWKLEPEEAESPGRWHFSIGYTF
jgi:outer membrane protein insertion porin family